MTIDKEPGHRLGDGGSTGTEKGTATPAPVKPAAAAEATAVPVEDRHPPIWWLLDRFHLNLDALREMLTDFMPEVARREAERLGPKAMAAVSTLDEEGQKKLLAVLEDVIAKREAGDKTNLADEDGVIELGPDFVEVFTDDRHALSSFLKRLQKAVSGPNRTAIMHNSLLTQAIAAFEVLVSGVTTRYYLAHRDALDSSEKTFTLGELRELQDLEDAADIVLQKHVADVMQGGLAGWEVWYQRKCQVKLADLALDWSKLVESFQRRHVIIHNGALVSRQYVEKVRHAGEPPTIGSRLEVDADYLNDCLDGLDVLGTLLGARAWGTWDKEARDHSAAALLNRSYDLMLQGRWRAVEALTAAVESMKCAEAIKHPLRANYYLSRFELYGPKHVHDDVLAWDTSALMPRFELVKLVLLEELDQAAALVPRLLESGQLDLGELREWPILRTLREHEGFTIG